ncbi:MAG: diaminopimelate decarboxylase [Clostridia bacterium]|nr:diaminopimelate decarboxylase [Clostridia bacterium]
MHSYFTQETGFYGKITPEKLIRKYGSPLYVYNESILRQRCKEVLGLITYPNFKVNYSIKANSNLELLKIVRAEGCHADAMSPGEIYVLLKAGFSPDEIFYIGNNVSKDEMQFAIGRGILVSVDSLAQLRQLGEINPGGPVAVRFNPGIGAGHHEKVVTAGKNTKFGINMDYIDEVKALLRKYNLQLVGINQHIGSLFMEGKPYLEGVKSILSIARQFENLDFVDLGGGFGIPYRKQGGEKRLNLKALGQELTGVLENWVKDYGKEIAFKVEPGRYLAAECGVLLGSVFAVKQNYGTKYVGTDLGFNVLARPVIYDSYHEIEVYRHGSLVKGHSNEAVTIVGNICESGDIIAKDRVLPSIEEGDILGIMDAGAYGFAMSSNYNNRLRPAEVLIGKDGTDRLIRKRDTLEDLMKGFEI